MPRKQNGFGASNSLSFKPTKSVKTGKGQGAAGYYPSDRRFGSTVHRSVIESYDLDSDWVKWRKGFEYYNQSAWYRLETLNPNTLDYEVSRIKSTLYKGSVFELDVEFDGYKFATSDADSNNHYVVKRNILGVPDDHGTPGPPTKVGYNPLNLGTVVPGTVRNDAYYNYDYTNKEYLDLKARKEIWLDVTFTDASLVLTQMIGERINDGVTEATLSYILNSKHQPSVYVGKSLPRDPVEQGVILDDLGQVQTVEVKSKLTTLDITIDKDDLTITPEGQELLDGSGESIKQMLAGKVVYVPSLFRGKPIFPPGTTDLTFIDGYEYFVVEINDTIDVGEIDILKSRRNSFAY